MNHEILRDKCRKAFGDRIPMQAREQWVVFIREERTDFTFRYEWIKDPRFYTWISENQKNLEIRDGSERFGVYICHPNGEPINRY